MSQEKHRWRFFRTGGFDQVRLDSVEDLKNLTELDQKLWAVLSMPVANIEFDIRTLKVLDTDADGRIRVPEVKDAVGWTCRKLKHHQSLLAGSLALKLEDINDADPEGSRILASARQILKSLGKPESQEISAEETADIDQIFSSMRFNGDGIVPPESSGDEAIASAIRDIITCMGSLPDRSGKPGVDPDLVERFFTEVTDYIVWLDNDPGQSDGSGHSGLDPKTAYPSYIAVKDKIDDYFNRCRLVSFDSNAQVGLNPAVSSYEVLNNKSVHILAPEIADLPLARIEPDKPLDLTRHVNPAWIPGIDAFYRNVFNPIAPGQDILDEAAWEKIKSIMVAYEAHQASKKGTAVESLGKDRLLYLQGSDLKGQILALIDQDQALKPEADSIALVDKLVLLHRDLMSFLRNFVSLADFYNPKTKAVFQAGNLYIDQRCCDLCVVVDNVTNHSAVAQKSGVFLAYLECSRKDRPQKINIAAAITNGDADHLIPGRNGVFYDRKNNDWDANIVKIADHPISLRQSFWSPYKKAIQLIGEQIQKFASSGEKSVEQKMTTGISEVSQSAASKPETPSTGKQAFDVGKFAGIFAAIGLAIGAIGTAIASIVTGFLALQWWKMPIAILGLMLLISGPSMLLAYLKLRKRNLAPILDANGWAVNTHARLNIPFGTALTTLAVLPPGSSRDLSDPYADKKNIWTRLIVLLFIVAAALILWKLGFFDPIIDLVTNRQPPVEPAPPL